MRVRAGVLLGLAFLLGTATASATTHFRYRDARSGCDVFTDRADRIPRNGRDGARMVSEDEAVREKAASLLCQRNSELLSGLGNDRAANEPALGRTGIDARLSANSGRFLTDTEVVALRQLASPRVAAFILAALAALVAWIAVMVAAVREEHLIWAVLMLFLSTPVAFMYLFIGPGKERSRFKAACALGILSPLLVLVASACHLFPMAAR